MNNRLFFLSSLVISASAVVGFPTSEADEFHAVRTGGSWSITNVATTPPNNPYTFNSLAIKPNNQPAFVYHEYGAAVWDESFPGWAPSQGPGKLRYAEFDGTGWTTTVVDDDGNTGFSGSLAFDSSGTPHISYVNYSADTLRYATRVNGTWQTRTLDYIGPSIEAGNDVSATTLVLHPVTGDPTISYFHQSTFTYRFGTLSNDVFASEAVETFADTVYPSEGRFLTHDLDSQGNPHLAYWTDNTADGTYGLEYATRDSQGAWTFATISDAFGTWYSDLKVGSDDIPRVAYHDEYMSPEYNTRIGVLRFAEQTEAGWQSTLIDGGTQRNPPGVDYVGWHPSLALDAGNTPHISYADVHGQSIKYATRNDNTWSTEIIDQGTDMIGLLSSLAIDANGGIHVAYDPPVAPVPEPSTLALTAVGVALLAWRLTAFRC